MNFFITQQLASHLREIRGIAIPRVLQSTPGINSTLAGFGMLQNIKQKLTANVMLYLASGYNQDTLV